MDRSRIRSYAGLAAAVRLADELASALDLRDLEEPRGGHVVAIDGCSSACARRTLEARGLSPLAVNLDEFGLMPDESVRGRARATLRGKVIQRLEAQATISSQPSARRRRSSGPSVHGPTKPAHTTHDYLYAIHLLTSPVAICGAVIADTPTIAAQVAGALSVTRATAGEMISRLEAAGLVARGPAKEILLTPEGRAAAEHVVHRQRLVERFLVDTLDYSAAESYRLALEIRDAFPEIVTERLETLTARSVHCPHGWPVDPSCDQDFAADLVALSTLPEGAKTTVAALMEHDASVLEQLFRHGLAPGVSLAVVKCHGRVEVEIQGQRCLLKNDEAAAVLVPRDYQ